MNINIKAETMIPDDFTYNNNQLINLVKSMFKKIDITKFLTPEVKKKMTPNGKSLFRHYKLDESDIVRFLMQPRTETMQVETQVFLELIGSSANVTKEDIIIRRSDLDAVSFRDFNLELTSKTYRMDLPRIAGRLVLAFDGTMISLQQTRELMDAFGGHPSKTEIGSPLSRTEVLCDTETQTIIDAEFGKFRSDEGSMAVSMMDRMPGELKRKHPVVLFDRKYCGFRTVYAAKRNNLDFVIRVKRNFSKEVDNFIASGKREDSLFLEPTPKSVKRHQKRYPSEGFGGGVRVYLCRTYDGDEPVILMSSFPLSCEDGLRLYPLRWKAESAIDSYKNLFQVEIFSGNRPFTVRQDFYARLVAYNIFFLCLHAATLMCLKRQEEKDSSSAKPLKYAYRLNANASLHRFKEVFPKICYGDKSTDSLLLNLINFMTKFHEPIRPDRHFGRRFRAIKLFGKYITIQNYRRAI